MATFRPEAKPEFVKKYYFRMKDYLEKVILADLGPSENITDRLIHHMCLRQAVAEKMMWALGKKKTSKIWDSVVAPSEANLPLWWDIMGVRLRLPDSFQPSRVKCSQCFSDCDDHTCKCPCRKKPRPGRG